MNPSVSFAQLVRFPLYLLIVSVLFIQVILISIFFSLIFFFFFFAEVQCPVRLVCEKPVLLISSLFCNLDFSILFFILVNLITT